MTRARGDDEAEARRKAPGNEMTVGKNWRVRTVGELCDFVSGNGFTPQDWKRSGLPIIRIQNLNGSRTFNYFQGEPDRSWLVEPGDLLFAWAGVKGVSFGPTIWNGPRGVLNQHIYRIRPKAGVSKHWLYYALDQVTSEIERKAHGFKKSLVHVHKSDITGAKVVVPPLSEQASVANALAWWDGAIQSVDQLIESTKRRHTGLVYSLISDRHARRQWETIELGRVIREREERTSSHDQYPVLTSSRRGIFLQSEYFSRQVTSANNTGYKVMHRGDFTFRSMSDDGRFVFNRLASHDTGIISPAYGVFCAMECSPEFLVHFLNSRYFAGALNRESQGGTRKALRFTAIAKLAVDFPALPEQRRVARALDSSLRELEVRRTQVELLRRQKRGVTQRLLNGQWRVKNREMSAA